MILPEGFPRAVAAFACDLDRTLIAEDGELRPRTRAAIAAVRGAGVRFVIATGRMYRSVLPYLRASDGDEPVICYQGALVADPTNGRFLLHEPIPLEVARETIAAVEAEGFALNCYVDDELYVAEVTENARAYADFQNIPLNAVGPLLDWLEAPPTKLVAVDAPETLDELRPRLERHFGERLYIAKSLPYFLEFASPRVSKGSGLVFVAEHLGLDLARTVGIGDGENDLELLAAAGYSIAVENGHELAKARADFICPGPTQEGVAQVLEAYLDWAA